MTDRSSRNSRSVANGLQPGVKFQGGYAPKSTGSERPKPPQGGSGLMKPTPPKR